MSWFFGTAANETLDSSNWNNEWVGFGMGNGTNKVITPNDGKTYSFIGGDNKDYFWGGTSGDWAFGGNGSDRLHGMGGEDHLKGQGGHDILYGGSGKDFLYGGDSNDTLYGGSGNDTLVGGAGPDKLYGGTGRDTFNFANGDSNFQERQYDTVFDWNARFDRIDSTTAGTQQNYDELQVRFGLSMGKAKLVVENDATLSEKTHVFVYGGGNGYLISDLDHDGSFETGVLLKGEGRAADMSWDHII